MHSHALGNLLVSHNFGSTEYMSFSIQSVGYIFSNTENLPPCAQIIHHQKYLQQWRAVMNSEAIISIF